MNLPGGPHFDDVTHLFDEASEDMALDELLLVDGFTLNEAMSAVEIGDPRMDSGAALPVDAQQHPPFDPLAPLLPGEVCWVLDRALTCEMHWHAGNALAQTVFTCLYMHHLAALVSDAPRGVADRAVELVTRVVRPGIAGMVKCCDLAYRELTKGNVHDCEDWQGEKSDVSMCEGIAPQHIVTLLEEAEVWLYSDETSDLPLREELLHRIQLRKALLRLYALELPRRTSSIVPLVTEARALLAAIRLRVVPPPCVCSRAHAAFDPHITRQLHSIMPLRPLVLPPQEEAWRAVEGLLDGWELVFRLSGCESLLAWSAAGIVRASNPKYTPSRLPFVRSVVQTVFSGGINILDRFPIIWLVERFFFETAHIPPGHLASLFENRPFSAAAQAYEDFHNTLARFVLQHIWASYHNRPRQRRHSMKTSLDWHVIYENALLLVAKVAPRDVSDSRVLKCIPLAVLHWRAHVLRDIVLSGFELALYAPDERPFAYWYLARVLSGHEAILRDLLYLVPEDTPAHGHLTVQFQYATVLKEMSLGCFLVLCRPPKFDAARRWTNFTVRYKWALRKDFEAILTPDPFLPDFRAYLRQERKTLRVEPSERWKRAAGLFDSALLHLVHLGLAAELDFSLQLCRVDFTQHHLGGLLLACSSLKQGASAASGAQLDDSAVLEWNPKVCAWFPQILPLPTTEADS
ncbi:Mak10 subunit, NatC N-terminal acetyltransferase-domain-containing protein [Phellopilus nigrolimitatus]|nr:Mak10 subunit, NatC N-terminal acetyltransferase-domain-containing protein [Phellopilus nigrolimitatus]